MSMSVSCRFVLLATLGAASIVAVSPRQAADGKPPTTNIEGHVVRWVDLELQPVKGATVYAIHESLGLVCTTTSLSNGDWRCEDVPPGDLYTIVAEKETADEICSGSISFGPVRRNRTTTIPAVIMECGPVLP